MTWPTTFSSAWLSTTGTGVSEARKASGEKLSVVQLDFKGSGSMTVTRDEGSRASGAGRWAAPIVDGGAADTLRVTADFCRVK